MDVNTAYAVLRLKPESSLTEANEVFDAQAIRFDPDRVKRSLRPAAESKMAEVNEAWEVVRGHLQSGGGPVTYEPDPLPEPSHGTRPIASELRSVDTVLTAEAGWYPQPDDAQRYWDGQQWTAGSARPVVYMMTFSEAIKSGLTKYVDFSGRARPSEFWWFELFTIITSLGAGILDEAFNFHGVLSGLTVLALILPIYAVSVRRLHDTNRSGWSLLLSFIPLLGGIILLVFVCEVSQDGPNRYGSLPRQR